ncbi:uncharacterized protein B0H18DRAFT_880577, partial [Fomitopsis serialis]|uniref:uncharacterized protein n=1 Tax=Fomitopsis serialis TaxID=139415 RepID=UPI00200801BC
SSFTPSSTIDMAKERDWAASLGMLDWDNTQIVFNKRSLLEFLKYAGVTVDPNFTNIQKLPRYARFGTLAEDADAEHQTAAQKEAAATAQQAGNAYRPSRRVRTAPGGGHTDIFGADDSDALAGAPPRPDQVCAYTSRRVLPSKVVQGIKLPELSHIHFPLTICRPPRNTSSGVSGLWDAPDPQAFKPTRRVREMPGGKDSISSVRTLCRLPSASRFIVPSVVLNSAIHVILVMRLGLRRSAFLGCVI